MQKWNAFRKFIDEIKRGVLRQLFDVYVSEIYTKIDRVKIGYIDFFFAYYVRHGIEIGHFTCHSLRHTFATRAIENGFILRFIDI